MFVSSNRRVGAAVAAVLVLSGLFVGSQFSSERASAASWAVTVVDALGSVGAYTSIAVDAGGRPHISYEDATTGSLKHAWYDGVMWNTEVVRAVGCAEIFTSIALDAAGRPHIAYHSCGSLMHSWWTGASWVHEVVDSPSVGRHNSIALDSLGRPRITYYDNGNRWLEYAEWNGTAWNIQAADTENLVGEWNSLELDSLERPHISYFRRNSNNLRYVRWDGSQWVYSLVDSVGQVGYGSSLELDGNDYAHIAYHGSSAKVLKYASWTGAVWNVQTVDTTVGSSTTVRTQSLALGSMDSPQIAYQDVTLGNLKYARWTGLSWNLTVVDGSANIVGGWPSLALEATGTAHVSYYDATAGDLKYAVLRNLPPSTPAPPSGPTSGVGNTSYAYSTVAVDPDADPIMYTFDWGDGTTSDTGFNASGVPVTLSHAWATAGTYTIRVRATDSAGGSSAWSAPLNVTIVWVPTAPVGLAATPGDTQITLAWSAPLDDGGSPVTNYRIYRGNSSGGEVFLIEIGNVLTYLDTGLTNGQAYYYNVTAKNAYGEGPWSNEATASPRGRPDAPTGLAATPGDTQIVLAWSAPASDGGSPITNYRIYRGLVSGGEVFLVEIGNLLTYLDTGLVNGQPYYYNVTAKNAVGEGPSSNEASATPVAGQTIPSAPLGLAATPGDTQITLTWSAPLTDGGSPITNYRIYRGLVSGGEGFLIEIGNVLTYLDAGLVNGQPYYYNVTAKNGVGEGPSSNEATATPRGLPDAPTGLAATPGDAQVILTWSAPAWDGGSPITNYSVYRGPTSGGEAFLVQLGNVLNHTDVGLTNGVTYFYTVTATNDAGEGPSSNEANATPATTPTEPQNLQAFAGNTEITLTWQAPLADGGFPITNYRIYRGLSSGTEVFLVEIGAVLTFLDTGLTNGQEYCYVVSAVNVIGEGPPSNEWCATPTAGPTVPSQPLNLTAVGGDAQVVLTWNAPASDGGSPILNYRIHRSLTSGAEVFLAQIGNVLTYTDAPVVNGQTYYYMVSAVNGIGEGPRSNESFATPASPPAAPQNLTAAPGSGSVALSWDAPASDGGSPVTNYTVYRGLTSGAEVFLIEIGNVLTHLDTGLTNGQPYYYNVTAKNTIGEGPWSNEATATPTGPPGAPAGLAATPGDAQVGLTWSAPASDGGSPITNYRIYRGVTPGGEAFLVEIGNVLTYLNTGLTNGQSYYYKVTAKNAFGEGPTSNEATATPLGLPGAPIVLAATPGNAQIVLTWSAPASDGGSPVTNYRIYRGLNAGGEIFLVEVGNVLTYTNVGLTNGQVYYYVVRARNAVGEGPASIEVSATPSSSNQPPTCTITSPLPNETISGVYSIQGTAGDADGTVQLVEVRIDAGPWSPATLGSPWTYALNTMALANGQHSISGRSYDGSSYCTEVTMTIIVFNSSTPPPGGSLFGQWWFWFGLILVIALLLLFLFLLWRRRKEEDEPEPSPGPTGAAVGTPAESPEEPEPDPVEAPADDPDEPDL